MTKIRVYQPLEEQLPQVKHAIDVEEQNPNEEMLRIFYTRILETEDMSLPDSYMEEDILIDSIEGIVNASASKLRNLGAYDVIIVENKGKKTTILILEEDEYEIISE
ncbi:hypothetical protein [Ectobacillus sp. sgz5001026]|uniref:hypothetical protein n=1 Tax=Ectobacillus sp. sgz5001026 TaxID=3242473 RepID=UPI0036D28B92